MHFITKPKALRRSRSSSFVNAESDSSHERETNAPRIPQLLSLPRLRTRSVMNIPNISISSFIQGHPTVGNDSFSSEREASSNSSLPSDPSPQSNGQQDIGLATNSEILDCRSKTSLHGGHGKSFESAAQRLDRRKHHRSVADIYDNLRQRSQKDAFAYLGSNLAIPIRSRSTHLHEISHKPPTIQSLADSETMSIHSDDTATATHGEGRPLQPIGKWRCCKCQRGHDIFNFTKGAHPVSILNCVCTHRSCVNCTLDGLIKRFEPMNNVEVVQLSEDGLKQMRFGVFCDACGLSWRAQEVEEELSRKSPLQRISALPRRLKKRGAHPLEKLRYSQSMNNLSHPHSLKYPSPVSKSTLNLRALSNEMEKGHGKQAEFATVKFTGIRCTCGFCTEARSLCFQVVDPPRDFHEATFAKFVAERKVAAFTSTLEDQAKGHGTPMLKLKGGQHVNPLMSNPVTKHVSIE